MSRRRTLVGAVVAAAGVAGGLAVHRAIAGRGDPPPAGPADATRRQAASAAGRRAVSALRARTAPATLSKHDAAGRGAAGRAASGRAASGRAAPDAPSRAWPAGTRHRTLAMSDGGRLHVALRGTGQPLVLLHGITLSAAIWYQQLARLPDAGFQVVAVDQRGHGRSTAGREGLTLDRLALDVGELVEHLDLDDVVVVGHSMGGMIALRLLAGDLPNPALRRQATGPLGPGPATAGRKAVSGLCLVATSASPLVGRGLPGVRQLVGFSGPLLAGASWVANRLPGLSLPDDELADPFAALTFGPHPSPAQVRLTRRATSRVPVRVAVELLAQIVRFDEAAALDRIELPTTVVVGSDDLITPASHARALVSAIAGAELLVLEGCGHMVMLERPADLDAALQLLAARTRGDGTMKP